MITKTRSIIPATPTFWERINWTWAHTFLSVSYIAGLLLIVPGLGGFRPVVRTIGYAFSLYLLYKFKDGRNRYLAYDAARAIMVIFLLELCLHPYNNSVASASAETVFALAILGTVFWVPQVNLRKVGFESMMMISWIFQTSSAFFGVLQVLYPGKFMPPISEVIANSAFGVDALSIVLSNGTKMIRPPGLTDYPGGAGAAGYTAFVIGIVIFLRYKNPLVKGLSLSSCLIGLFCMYLSEIRSLLVLSVVTVLFLGFVLFKNGQFARSLTVWVGSGALFFVTFTWAIIVGGQRTLRRIMSLFAGSATDVYQQHRGGFLTVTIDALPQYPLGAGLGRWGMMNYFFGDWSNSTAPSLWVEIQWTGWLYDGGIPLILAYSYAIITALLGTFKIAGDRKMGDFSLWAALIFGLGISTIINLFSYPIFASEGGLEFWLLNAALWTAATNQEDSLAVTQK